ncbi:MAG: hypothetical protein J6K99_04520 [Peptococcaceae bacterium]|nr:hypothetical protein [Peptococcaceae bacterium]
MIKLDQVITLARLKTALTKAKAYIDEQISALAQTVSSVMEDVDSSITSLEADMKTKGNCAVVSFKNKSVATTAWASDTTYADYPYRAAISCSGVTADHIPDVTLSTEDADSLNFAAVANTGANMVYIYAAEKPTASITVLTIECRKAVV